ncbi:MAG: hypothetical protein M3R06_04165 [Chloroflexota bacterium]|nr:hypothetical protein [Chloroflexota bacterium]
MANAEVRPAVFLWKDHSRFVEVHPVRTGWFVLWGHFEEAGRRKVLAGNRIYPTLSGVRRRFGDSVLELTRNRALALEALGTFDRFPFPAHNPNELPEPL